MQNTKSKYECCPRLQGSSEAIICSLCKKRYHCTCVNISKSSLKELTEETKLSWQCPACQNQKPKSDNTNTPLRSPVEVNYEDNVTLRRRDDIRPTSEWRNMIREEMAPLIQGLQTSLTEQLTLKTKELLEQMNNVSIAMNFIEQQYEDIRKEISSKFSNLHALESENIALKASVADLNTRLTQMEKHSRASNVEIQCIPEHSNENLGLTIKQIASTINCKLSDTDIHVCTRIAKVIRDSPRPRSVLVKFSCPRVRDGFLAAAKTFNKKVAKPAENLNSSHLGIGGDKRPIYVVEHLSPAVKALHAAARIKAKELKYRYVWVKGGHVYMRKLDDTNYVFVRNKDALADLV